MTEAITLANTETIPPKAAEARVENREQVSSAAPHPVSPSRIEACASSF